MESISENDIKYIIAINASEESTLIELPLDFKKWDCEESVVLNILIKLIEDGLILFSKPVGNEFEDFNKRESIGFCANWESLNRRDIIIFFTEIGDDLWMNDDWGISRKRAHELLFKK